MPRFNRRDFMRLATVGVGTLALSSQRAPADPSQGNHFTLSPLPYAADALEPIIDRKTMETHHGKHHRGYVEKLNKALQSLDRTSHDLETILQELEPLPASLRTTIRNNGGGHYNHSLFWSSMTPPDSAPEAPQGKLAEHINKEFDNFQNFQERFHEAGLDRFGSGWVWLVWNADVGRLEVTSTPNQDTPILDGSKRPLLGNDCWEHAYYLSYQNRRSEYLKAWWKVVNWPIVEKRFQTVLSG